MSYEFDVAALLSPPDILQCKRVLCVQPHPDDNEIGMGGVIAALSDRGCEVHYLTVTNGDKGHIDKSVSPEETAMILLDEGRAAGRALGAKEFYFLGHGDGLLSDVLGLSKEIAGVIRHVQPDAVFCPDPHLPYEGHWDHIVTGRATSHAFQMSGIAHFRLAGMPIPYGDEMPAQPGVSSPWQVKAIGYYFTARPNTVVDITDTFERKMASIALHTIQIDAQTLAMYRLYFTMKGEELAAGRGFEIGEGLKVLSKLHTHCFVDADNIGMDR